MLQPEETQRLKISRKKDKWPQLTVKKGENSDFTDMFHETVS